MISRKRVSVISVCLLLFILASLLLYGLETGKIRNQVHHGTDHEDGRAERLEACRLADGGFYCLMFLRAMGILWSPATRGCITAFRERNI